MKNIIITLLSIGVFYSCTRPEYYDIREYGAKSGRTISNTKAIQKAIDHCHRKGGGTVYVPPGVYVTGTLLLKSFVNLHLETGAILLGSADSAEYPVIGMKRGIIFADDATHISITGRGEIDGRGTTFHDSKKPHISADFDKQYTRQGDLFMDSTKGFEDGPIAYRYRPGMMIVIMRCSNVQISDVTFRDAPEWTVRIGDCEDVVITGIRILNNLLIPNSDGIHCTHSRNVRISNCHFEVGDDAIIVSGFPYGIDVSGVDVSRTTLSSYGNNTRWAENITVSNSTMISRSAGVRVGYGDYGIRNCVFQNLVIYNSNRGIGIFSRDTGSIENILFNNIVIETRLHSGHWWGKGEPIHVSAIRQNKKKKAGIIRNVTFSNILAKAETGMVFYADEDSLIDGITMNNIRLTIKNGELANLYGGNIDLRPTAYPEKQIFKSDIPAILFNGINDVTMRDISVCWSDTVASYFTSALKFERSETIFVDHFRGEAAPGSKEKRAIVTTDCSNFICK